MNFKSTIKMVIDISMSILLFLLMSFQFTEQKNHEVIGAAMLVLFLLHNIMNYRWYLALGKGKYFLQRSIMVIADILLLSDMIAVMISGMRMSRYVFKFLDLNMSQSFAMNLHMFSSYTGFLLMGFHIGLHYGMIKGMFCKAFRIANKSKIQIFILKGIAKIIPMYGVYALFKRNFISYITLKMHFVLWDYEEPAIFYELDLLAIMILMIFK
ncbi:DUF4405 domain-containing protein [uncultured Clostridium sp.]|uniref:DUF4405 domain-containing protein n=1 Tax=uncultured Clostridium sp. TaxID=59620 RepID=UPI0025CD86C9|nr:DUF4405 domain-containing protein [uncultured Clostridium sp.]